jgi:hypothetical protein
VLICSLMSAMLRVKHVGMRLILGIFAVLEQVDFCVVWVHDIHVLSLLRYGDMHIKEYCNPFI